MGINFSRLLTLKYGNSISGFLQTKYSVISVGRVMTCVLGMVVRREREIREFVKTPFYRLIGTFVAEDQQFEGEWRAVKGSRYFESFDLYKENGFKERKKAEELMQWLQEEQPAKGKIAALERKKERERKNPALLFNLAGASRMNVLGGLRSAQMKPPYRRNFTRKRWSPIRVQMPVKLHRGCKRNPSQSERTEQI